MNLQKMVDYDRLRRDFDWKLPSTFNFGRDVVDYWARESANRCALVWTNEAGDYRRLTFSDISRNSSQLAHLLAKHGIQRGDRVIVMLPRIPEWQLAMVACLKLGAIPVPCIEMLTPKDVAYRAAHSGAVAAITTYSNTAKFDGLAGLKARIVVGTQLADWIDVNDARSESEIFECADLSLEDPAILYYTSGSSGNPKGVLHATRGLYAWRGSATYWQTLQPSDVKWCTSDTGWSKAGTGILFGPWSMGATVFFYDGTFDAKTRLELMRANGVTVYCAAATEFRQLVQLPTQAFEGLSLRLAVSAGEAVNPDVVRRWSALTGVQLLDGYGQTETLLNIVNYPCMPVREGSMGKPLPGTVSRILDGNGKIAAPMEVGRLALQLPSPTLMLGYWNDPQRTQESIVEVESGHYWITGDLAYMDGDGYIFYSGRDDDIIGSAGYRIGPTEVENALIEHPAVLESAVVASPDAARGEVVKAFVVLSQGFAGSPQLVTELQEHVKRTTAPYKYPRKVEFVDALPKNVSGKVVRRLLRDREFELNSVPKSANS